MLIILSEIVPLWKFPQIISIRRSYYADWISSNLKKIVN